MVNAPCRSWPRRSGVSSVNMIDRRHNGGPTLDDEIVTLAAECEHDPNAWWDAAYDWGEGDLASFDGLRDWQWDIGEIIGDHLQNPETRFDPLMIAVASGHGIGKSALIGMVCDWAMSTCDNTRVVITANTDTQLRTITSPEVSKWFRRSLTAHWWNIHKTRIERKGKEGEHWALDFKPWSEHNTEAFAGLHNVKKRIVLIFDEASKIADKVWEVAEGAMTDQETEIIWIVFGNPTRNIGRFRECFRKYRAWWHTRQIDSRTVPGTNKKYLDGIIEREGEDSDVAKVRVRGQFPSQSFRQFISEADADAARNRHYRPDQYEFAPRIIGVDPAWTGDDSFEIYFRQGLYSKHLASYPRNDNDVEMAGFIAKFEDDYKADAVFVDAGYGTGIVSIGQVMGRAWRLVWFSGKPLDKGYMNKRAELWGLGRKWLKSGGAIDPADQALYDDIIGPETVPRMDGRIQLESKEDMKERQVPSPNKADALFLTFAEPVARKDGKDRVEGNNANKVESDYEPYA